MKVIIVLCALVAVVLSRPQPQQQNSADAVINKYDYNNDDDGGYSFSLETSDGITRNERAEVINAGREDASLVVRGFYSYTGPDGVLYTVYYVADENGFQPEGTHIPPSAGVAKPQLGIQSAVLASLAG